MVVESDRERMAIAVSASDGLVNPLGREHMLENDGSPQARLVRVPGDMKEYRPIL